MKNFKQFMNQYHGQNKTSLHGLYTDRQVYYSSLSSSEQPVENEKLFRYRAITFQFAGTGFRTPEQMLLHLWIPEDILPPINASLSKDIPSPVVVPSPGDGRGIDGRVSCLRTACEDWLLRLLGAPVNAYSETLQNDRKDTREKAAFAMQEPGAVILSRNGCLYVEEKRAYRLKILCRFPLINGSVLNGKSSYKCVKALLDLVCDRLEEADPASLAEHLLLYSRQLQLRALLRENDLLAFIADGSILPRLGTTRLPLPGAIPFQSPPSLRVTLRTQDGYTLTGMGLKRGVTVITGGGYSGKSTLLDCLEQGIYHHVAGDGREYLISDESACKVSAEDGRYLSSTDLSPFFTCLPGNDDPRSVRTSHASGSVSQAAGIIEAVYGGSRCLLIDEDTSAANFMMRDETMRRLIRKEPIIPFTDRILELKEQGISTVLVIGGSGEYLKYADQVLLMEDYRISDLTERVQFSPPLPDAASRADAALHKAASAASAAPAVAAPVSDALPWNATAARTAPASPDTPAVHSWMRRKSLPRSAGGTDDFYGQCVRIEHARYLKIGGFTADITRLTALTESGQAGSLIWLLEQLLSNEDVAADLRECCDAAVGTLFYDSRDTMLSSHTHQYELWLEQIRSLDLILAACRLRPDDSLST